VRSYPHTLKIRFLQRHDRAAAQYNGNKPTDWSAVHRAGRIVDKWCRRPPRRNGAASEWKPADRKLGDPSITCVPKRLPIRKHVGRVLMNLCDATGIIIEPRASFRRRRDPRGFYSVEAISAVQLHSSLNGGSLPHGGMDELMPPAPPHDGDTPLDPDPLLDTDTLLDVGTPLDP